MGDAQSTGTPSPTAPLVGKDETYASVTRHIAQVPLAFPYPWRWLALLGLALAGASCMVIGIVFLVVRGVGIWGINVPVAWGFAIINFVFWIEIAHAGTLISAILLLAKQRWRNSVNRFAEAMTVFAVVNAGTFPFLHLGRLQRFYYLLPYPNSMDLWPQWRSPLVFDIFAVSAYAILSALFWYLGLVPDLATMRDRARSRTVKRIYGFIALGWSGEARHWQHFEAAYRTSAGLAAPLVVSVLSIVSLDFSSAIVAGWHETIFPPSFLFGAIYSGMAMVFTIAIPLRSWFHLERMITEHHLNVMGKMLLAAGLLVTYDYAAEWFIAFYSGDPIERQMQISKAVGTYAWEYWLMIFCNVVVGMTLWWRRVRTNTKLMFVISLVINVGMWLDRFRIVVPPLTMEPLPSSWGTYEGTFWDWMLLVGAFGVFATLMVLFIRVLPMSSMLDMRELVEQKGSGESGAEEAGRSLTPGERLQIVEGRLYGWMAEYASEDAAAAAVVHARAAGYVRPEVYGPMPSGKITEALHLRRPIWVQLFMIAGGVTGGAAVYLMQYFAAVHDYPWNVGGRPFDSWPAFVIPSFVLGILAAFLSGLLGFLIVCRLPRPYQPVFNLPMFAGASLDRFYVVLTRSEAAFDFDRARDVLAETGPRRLEPVPD